jgi:hypothetical protein
VLVALRYDTTSTYLRQHHEIYYLTRREDRQPLNVAARKERVPGGAICDTFTVGKRTRSITSAASDQRALLHEEDARCKRIDDIPGRILV